MARETYQQLVAQIAKLQAKAEAMRVKAKPPVIVSILQLMKSYSISVEELDLALSATRARNTKRTGAMKGPVASKRAAKPKYRDPQTGETWAGRGKPPRWMTAAEAAGVNREGFLI